MTALWLRTTCLVEPSLPLRVCLLLVHQGDVESLLPFCDHFGPLSPRDRVRFRIEFHTTDRSFTPDHPHKSDTHQLPRQAIVRRLIHYLFPSIHLQGIEYSGECCSHLPRCRRWCGDRAAHLADARSLRSSVSSTHSFSSSGSSQILPTQLQSIIEVGHAVHRRHVQHHPTPAASGVPGLIALAWLRRAPDVFRERFSGIRGEIWRSLG